MKIIDLLCKSELDSIDKLVQNYVKDDEFEVSILSTKDAKTNLLTLEKFNNLTNILSIVTQKNEEQYKKINEVTLDIIFVIKNLPNVDTSTTDIETYRITITGLEKINELMIRYHDLKNHLIFTSVLLKDFLNKDNQSNIKIIKKIKNFSSYITIDDLYLKFKKDREESVSKEELKKLLNINKNFDMNTYDIFFRLKDRKSYFIIKDKNIFRIDLTTVRTNNKINNIQKSKYKYEIEVECDIKNKSKVIEETFHICEFILKSVQGTNYIVTKSTSNKILTKYKEILNVNPNKVGLYGRQPISLELQHLIDLLPNKYAVSDKADGERHFMIVYETRCYFISNNLIVKDSGINIDAKYNNSIIDGELILIQKYNQYIFMSFDCLILGNNDVRTENKFLKRLEYLDELIRAINKLDYTPSYIYNSNIDMNNINEVLNFHKKNITGIYDDINNILNSKNNNIIFRRKYFLECLGIHDNDIFKYSELIWNLYTSDKNIHCPYLLDGLIYHPLEQKYVVEEEKSKYFEYKWKPPSHNSIDFYIEFERDKITNKIMTVYDNSIDGVVKNKPYQIMNLYTGQLVKMYDGQSNKNVEKPILFNPGEDVSQCYIYINEDNIPCSADGKQIIDKTVVEFYYNLSDDIITQYRWVPMKTRFDKTDSIQKYGRKYGNSNNVAKKIWRSITNPILMSDFTSLANDQIFSKTLKQLKSRIDVASIDLDKKVNVYYQKKSYIGKAMNRFHNWIKSNLVYTYANPLYNNNIQYKILDLGVGRGGDILKYYYVLADMVVGIDPDLEGLTNSTDSAVSRYQNSKKTHANFPPMYFIQANPANLLKYDEQVKILGKMNSDNKNLFNRFFTWDDKRIIFDRMCSQFSIHYLLANHNSWNGLIENINMYLREGGYIIITTFDGDLVKNKLKDVDKFTEYYVENGEKKVLFEIVKKYDDNSTEKIGQAIDVYMSWIFEEGIYMTEYLVYPDFLIKEFKEKCNLEVVETGLFEDMFNDNKDYLLLSTEIEEHPKTKKTFTDFAKFYEKNEMNEKCYSYSFLNRFYVFRKTETNLSEIKNKYYIQDKKKNIPGKIAYKKK